jgi:alpha-ketoglutarate-dependent taurine dioxygenase
MAIELLPIPLPATADASKFQQFGREVKGVDPANLSPEEFEAIRNALYTHDALLFRNAQVSAEQQYALTKVRFE